MTTPTQKDMLEMLGCNYQPPRGGGFLITCSEQTHN